MMGLDVSLVLQMQMLLRLITVNITCCSSQLVDTAAQMSFVHRVKQHGIQGCQDGVSSSAYN